MRTRLGLTLVFVAALAIGCGEQGVEEQSADVDAAAEDAASTFDLAHSDMTFEETTSFQDFSLYSLGQSFEGLALTSITQRDDPIEPNEPVRANYVGYIYGDCSIASGDEACAPPLEVQVWPACIRNHSTYQLTPTPGSQLPHTDVVVRGAPGAVYEEGHRLEVYTGAETVVIFGDNEAQLFRAADSLASVNAGGIEPGEPLPAPAATAMAGELTC
jgi:hypothetical protein